MSIASAEVGFTGVEVGFTYDTHKEDHNYKYAVDSEFSVNIEVVKQAMKDGMCHKHTSVLIRDVKPGVCCFGGKVIHIECKYCTADAEMELEQRKAALLIQLKWRQLRNPLRN